MGWVPYAQSKYSTQSTAGPVIGSNVKTIRVSAEEVTASESERPPPDSRVWPASQTVSRSVARIRAGWMATAQATVSATAWAPAPGWAWASAESESESESESQLVGGPPAAWSVGWALPAGSRPAVERGQGVRVGRSRKR
jgi:hypothetical protein